ncbi:MAG: TonB C-terminal domain-containing protein [Verrucomicrobiales bacterium]|nr:TonB C-terminal domain-containing protein [Verrucomicrobiales bacterium]
MDRTLQRCLVGSTAAHAAILLLVLLLGGLAARKVIEPEVPVLQFLPTDLRLTMGDQIGGGSPNPLPPATREVPGPPPAAQSQPPSIPTPPPQAPVPTPKVREDPPPSESATKPPAPAVTKTSPPRIEVAKEPRLMAKAQDVDPSRLPDKPIKMASAPTVQTSSARRRRTDEDKKAAEEAAEAAASASRARAERIATARSLAERLSGAATGVSKNVGASTQIEMPGPGGAAYAPYYAYLQSYLKLQWRKPTTSSEQEAATSVELTIARDGTLLSADITRRSGVKSLDSSVEDLFRRVRKLNPLPPEFGDARMVVPVKFVLDSSATP